MFRRIFSKKAELFELNPKFFPESTQSLIPLSMVLRHGVLPLGFKREKLNLGFLDPYAKSDLSTLKEFLRDQKFQSFEIKPEQMLAVLEARYSISLQEIRTSEIHPKMAQFLAEADASSNSG